MNVSYNAGFKVFEILDDQKGLGQIPAVDNNEFHILVETNSCTMTRERDVKLNISYSIVLNHL